LSKIKLLILDVDGVLTAGDLPHDERGSEVKVFHVQDGSAIRRWQAAGGIAAILSGRQSEGVSRRAKDLDIASVKQKVTDKLPVYEALCKEYGVADAEVSAIGDDYQDLVLMRRCGYPIAVGNAVAAVKRAAVYVTRRSGGSGAVAEAVERLMRHNGTWDAHHRGANAG
jgi:3-deoxy-D-manno-octulosonate 8-phosphate phosphatase (KDO 8-P phosphatase)